MKRTFVVLAAFFAMLLTCGMSYAAPIRGKVTCGRTGVAGVIVSDGRSFAQTDRKGRYFIDASEDAAFIFIVTPSGYASPSVDGTPVFYSPSSAKKHDFTLRKVDDRPDYDLVVMADPQMRGEEHLGKFRELILPDIRKTVASSTVRTVGITLGDISWNTGDVVFPEYRKMMETTGIQFYPVTGNHDYMPDSGDDYAAASVYREYFGPQNYAFALGDDYVVVLDNVIFDKSNKYVEGYSEETLAWLRGLLELIPSSSRLILAQHCPLYKWFKLASPMPANADKFVGILAGRETVVISGHNHINSTLPIADNILEMNVASACGAWWTTPHCTDGTPAGYKVLQVRGGKLSWYYKSAGFPEDHQLEVYGPGAVPYLPDCVTANVWDWNPDWSVCWYEDDKYMGEMEQTAMVSPEYCREIAEAYGSNPIPEFRKPSPSFHYFSAMPSERAKTVTVVATDGQGRSYSRDISVEKVRVADYSALVPMKNIGLLNANLGRLSAMSGKKETKTTFQTSREWTPGCDNRADAAMVYGIGGDPCDDGRTDATFEERAVSWRERGYDVQFMTGIAWGEYKDYYIGKWDGNEHFDEAQMEENGTRIMHGRMIPYYVPTLNYVEYIKKDIKRVIDAGISQIYLEEPEFWARGGYSESFKREWQDYYGFEWRPQHESPENTYLSNKLKYHLYYRALDLVGSYAKEYGRSKGMDVKIFVPTHSLINYSQWSIVSPEASLASLPGIDGYIAQVWTNTSKEPGFYEGRLRERIFETAFMEYGSMESMTAPTGRKMFFLTDPVEDKRRDWAEYKRNYEATYTAQLMYPGVANYEVMPWPNRIYERKYRVRADSDEMDWIPDFYATQMQIMINALNDMPLSVNAVSGSHGISVLMANSLMFQRLPVHDGYEDPFLINFMGQIFPLIKRGVPVGTVHMENLCYPQTLEGVDVLLMSYSNMKPMEEKMHGYLAEWVKNGGVIIYSARDDDPFQQVLEWWNSDGKSFKAPSDHLFSLMGIDAGASEGVYDYGKGKVCVLRANPKEYGMQEHGYDKYLQTVIDMYRFKGKTLEFKNSFVLERGIYDIIAVQDESVTDAPYHISGTFIDLYDCNLPVVHEKDIMPETQDLLINMSRVPSGKPLVLASATRASDIVDCNGRFSFIAKGPVRIKNVTRVYLPSAPTSVLINGSLDHAWEWDESSSTVLLRFDSSPDGTSVTISY